MNIVDCVTCGGPCESSRVQNRTREADARPARVYYSCPLCGVGYRETSGDNSRRIAPQLSAAVGLR